MTTTTNLKKAYELLKSEVNSNTEYVTVDGSFIYDYVCFRTSGEDGETMTVKVEQYENGRLDAQVVVENSDEIIKRDDWLVFETPEELALTIGEIVDAFFPYF